MKQWKTNLIAICISVATFLVLISNGLGEETDNATLIKQPENESAQIYGKLFLPRGYNKHVVPTTFENNTKFPVLVIIAIFVHSILEVDEKHEELILDTDFTISWIDQTLHSHYEKHNWTDPKTGEKIEDKILASNVLDEIWKPDVFIDEMASSDRTSILANLTTLNFHGEKGQGRIAYTARSTLKLRCSMDFQFYPADIQECLYHVRSYSYNASEVKILWTPRPAENKPIYLNEVSHPNFDVQIFSAEPGEDLKMLLIQEKFERSRRGHYAALSFTIKVRRKLSYHLVQTYLPSVLLILITWVCFLIPSDMIEARIGISMTTVLTLTAMFAAVRGQSPEVSYTMAIDVFMVYCIFSVFNALVLFTTIYWMKAREAKKMKKRQNSESGNRGNESTMEIEQNMNTKYTKVVNFTKKYGFWAFAIFFILFFITYWCVLLSLSEYFNWDPKEKYNAVEDFNDNGESTNYYVRHGYSSEDVQNLRLRLSACLNVTLEELRSPDYNNITLLLNPPCNNTKDT